MQQQIVERNLVVSDYKIFRKNYHYIDSLELSIVIENFVVCQYCRNPQVVRFSNVK